MQVKIGDILYYGAYPYILRFNLRIFVIFNNLPFLVNSAGYGRLSGCNFKNIDSDTFEITTSMASNYKKIKNITTIPTIKYKKESVSIGDILLNPNNERLVLFEIEGKRDNNLFFYNFKKGAREDLKITYQKIYSNIEPQGFYLKINNKSILKLGYKKINSLLNI
jgi:hypothetical protein